MPAAAVIPAPIAYVNVVAVKKLVVEFLLRLGPACALALCCVPSLGIFLPFWEVVHCKQIGVLKAGRTPETD